MEYLYAAVVINTNYAQVNEYFDYRIPENLFVCQGMRVIVPFGVRNSLAEAYVVDVKKQAMSRDRS